MKYSYKIKKSIKEDAWNWWHACNSISHGVDWKKQVDQSLAKKLYGKTQSEANKILIPFLKKVYISQKKNISKTKKCFQEAFDKNFQKGCDKIVEIMGRPIYRNDFTIFLTTMRRGPYYKKKGLLWICVYWSDPMDCFLHELCHFQFIHYWRENPKSKVSKLSEKQFEFLKESLTIILDKDFIPIIKAPDLGYKVHQSFRKKLTKQWKKDKDFDKLVDFGVKEIKKIV